jgi:hypothetical protein
MGKISDSMLLEILRRGEVLPDNINIEDEMESAGMDATEIVEEAESTEENSSEEMTPDRVDRLIELLSR